MLYQIILIIIMIPFVIILTALMKKADRIHAAYNERKDARTLKRYTGTAYFDDCTEEFEIFAFSSDEAFDIIEKESGRARRVDMQQHKL